MDSTISPRLVTSLLALLFCLVAWLRAGDAKPPVRTVTEVVGIAMVSPRAASAAPAGDPGAGVMHLAASGGDIGSSDTMGPMSADRWQALHVPSAPRAGRPAAPQPSAAKAAPRTSMEVARAAPAGKPRAGGKVRKKHPQRPPVLAQALPAAPPAVPALFMPLRQLGLSIQTKLPPSPAGGSPASKPAEPCGPTAV